MGLKYDKSNDEDVVELTKKKKKIIGYPSTELAEIHSEAMKLGNFDLEDQLESAKSTLSSKKSEVQLTLYRNNLILPKNYVRVVVLQDRLIASKWQRLLTKSKTWEPLLICISRLLSISVYCLSSWGYFTQFLHLLLTL